MSYTTRLSSGRAPLSCASAAEANSRATVTGTMRRSMDWLPGLQVRDGPEHFTPEVGADSNERAMPHLLPSLEINGVGRLEISLDGVVLEVDHGLSVVGDAAFG